MFEAFPMLIEEMARFGPVTTAGTSGSNSLTWPTAGIKGGNRAGARVHVPRKSFQETILQHLLHPASSKQQTSRKQTLMYPTARTTGTRNWKYGYCDLYENKANMVYVHHKA